MFEMLFSVFLFGSVVFMAALVAAYAYLEGEESVAALLLFVMLCGMTIPIQVWVKGEPTYPLVFLIGHEIGCLAAALAGCCLGVRSFKEDKKRGRIAPKAAEKRQR